MYFTVKRLLAALAILLPAALLVGLATPEGLHWGGSLDLATGRGDKGPWRQNASRYDYVDDGTVAFDAGGGLHAAWVDQQRKDVFFQNVSADGLRLGAPVNVSQSPATFSWLPRIAAAPADANRIYLLWQEIIFSGGSHGGDILFAASRDGGARFTKPLNLSQSPGGDGKGRLDPQTWSNGSLDLAVNADGVVLAAWTEYHGALWFARSLDGGASFSKPQRIAGDDRRPARAPSLAAGPGGAVYLAWTVGEDPAADIHIARSADAGASFGAPQPVAAGPGHADAPRLAVTRSGALHLVYAESAAGPGGRYAIRYARSPGGAGPFNAPRTISAPATQARASSAYPMLAMDGGDRLMVVWETFPDMAGRPQGLGVAWSLDAGKRFTRPQRVPGSSDPAGAGNGSQQGLLGVKLAMDRNGRFAIANSSLLPGRDSRVWLMWGRLPGP